MEEIINFKINTENIALTLPNEDQTVIHRLKSEDDFAGRYIINLINNGYLSLAEPVNEIYRIDDDNETLLYSSNSVEDVDEVNHIGEENVEEIQDQDDNIKKAEWTEAETKLLLDLYEENISRVGPMKKYKNKKNMWQDVSNIINKTIKINRTALQVENRYKTVLKRKKVAVENNIKTGSLRQIVPYEFELNKIGALDDSIEPEVLGSASGIRILKPIHNMPVDAESLPSTSKQETSISYNRKRPVLKLKKRDTLSQTLTLIHKEKEESRERRHKEKLELLKELFKK
ncbi:unnamed protein product [Psylliodes chrysocephalus]|uniref:Myb-like domain-containing protein n=1 Tax=Psylliodes chrysocephalus TaxID=3402493 RepID=A0A9P0GAM6_9CUCU|nr:unnamed protein product [Psylliodes chrysocephala]